MLGNGAKKALSSCGEKYRTILVPVIPQAIEALGKGDPKFA
ncbi:cell wall/vacuolar inhibitor of fructosidase 1-like, partial [Trifolium medium]|nr:cell wall/vacuolar inhibitor of fructosidase 1-like [Trifolium medium]